DGQAELLRRQATAGAYLEDRQSEPAQIARRERAAVTVSAEAPHGPAADVGEEADRQEALQAGRRGARQQDGAHCLCDYAGQDGVSRNSGVRSVGKVRGRGPPPRAAQESRVTMR